MNRQETLQLLADPSATATTWERVLKDYPADAITKAAQLHMDTSQWTRLPTPAELIKLIPRADLIARSERMALEAPKKKAKVSEITKKEDEFLDKFIEAQIEWEKEMWGDDDPTAGFLPYEQ